MSALENWLLRRRPRPMLSEVLPNGESVDEAVRRVAPLVRLAAEPAFDETLPDGTPAIQAAIPAWQRPGLSRRIASVLPPELLSRSSPNEAETNERVVVSPVTNREMILPAYNRDEWGPRQVMPFDAPSTGNYTEDPVRVPVGKNSEAWLPPVTRPRRVLPGETADAPAVMPTVLPESDRMERLRRVLPEDPLTVARENAQAARNLNLSDGGYGFDREGNPRSKPRGGFKGRLMAGLKMLGRGVGPGMAAGGPAGGLGGGLAAMIAGIANPELPARMRKEEAIRRNDATYEGELGRRKVEQDLQNDQITNEYNKARTQRLLNPQWKIQKDAQGRILRVNPDTGESQVIHNVKKSTIPRTEWVDDKLMVVEEGGLLTPAINKKTGEEVTSRTRGVVEVEIDGQTFTMGEEKAGMAVATAQRARVTEQNQASREAALFNQQEENRHAREKADYDNAVSRRADLERQIGELRKKQEKARAVANDPNLKANDYRKYEAAKQIEELDEQIGQREREYQGIKVQPPTPPRSYPQQSAIPTPKVVPTGNYAGRSIQRANVAAWGKERGLTEEEALKELERLQVRVN